MQRMLKDRGDWAATAGAFRWKIPEFFNIADACCRNWATTNPDKTALTHVAQSGDVQNWTYSALESAANRLANSFRARGIRQGDRVAIFLPQCPEVMVTHFAAFKLGAITVPLFTPFGPAALVFRLSDSAAKLIVTDAANLDKVLTVKEELPELTEIYCLSAVTKPVRSFHAELAAASDNLQPVASRADDPAMIIYTSGTTGPPKGALHAHRFLLGHIPSIEMHHGFFPKPNDCGWTPADWAWIGGLMDLALPCLYFGVPLVSHRMQKFDPGGAYDLISKHRIRNVFMPPTGLKLMQNSPATGNVDIRTISSGGESLGAATHGWAKQTLGAEINEIYGQTECNLVISSSSYAGVQRAGTMGQAVPGHDVRILDENGAQAAPGCLGEIAVRGPDPVMFLGYWNNPKATAAKYRGKWLMTGDMGTMDSDGYFTFSARNDDVISSAGYRIGPTEIENCLTGHPDVVMAAAVGIPDPIRSEVVKAYVVLRPGAVWTGLEARLIDQVRQQVSPHVAPKSIEQIAAMPLTATGKIIRRDLRQLPN